MQVTLNTINTEKFYTNDRTIATIKVVRYDGSHIYQVDRFDFSNYGSMDAFMRSSTMHKLITSLCTDDIEYPQIEISTVNVDDYIITKKLLEIVIR